MTQKEIAERIVAQGHCEGLECLSDMGQCPLDDGDFDCSWLFNSPLEAAMAYLKQYKEEGESHD